MDIHKVQTALRRLDEAESATVTALVQLYGCKPEADMKETAYMENVLNEVRETFRRYRGMFLVKNATAHIAVMHKQHSKYCIFRISPYASRYLHHAPGDKNHHWVYRIQATVERPDLVHLHTSEGSDILIPIDGSTWTTYKNHQFLAGVDEQSCRANCISLNPVAVRSSIPEEIHSDRLVYPWL